MAIPPLGPRGWYVDPAHRHEFRYWDGRDWTPRVADGGVTAIDALGAPAAPPVAAPASIAAAADQPDRVVEMPKKTSRPSEAGQQQTSQVATETVAADAAPLPPPPPPRPARRRGGRVVAWVVAVTLAVVGVLGFVLAAVADNSNKTTYKTDYAALGSRDAGTRADILNAQVARVKATYDAYVSASAAVRMRHEAVTDTFNQVVAPLDPTDRLGIIRAKEAIPKVIAAYQRSLKQERAAAAAYYAQLARLKTMGGR